MRLVPALRPGRHREIHDGADPDAAPGNRAPAHRPVIMRSLDAAARRAQQRIPRLAGHEPLIAAISDAVRSVRNTQDDAVGDADLLLQEPDDVFVGEVLEEPLRHRNVE